MAEATQDRTERNTGNDSIAFEQPLNERMRMFLRIELLHRQTLFHARDGSEFGSRAAIAGLLEILSITGRGDVRSDVLKELDRHAEELRQFQRTPGVDSGRLTTLMRELDELKQRLSGAGKQFMASLRDNEFLNTIRHRSAIPGGTCMFDLPEYGYWLHLPQETRTAQLDAWLDQLKPLCDAIAEVLWMTREASVPKDCVAEGGLYHLTLKKTDNYNLVRVLVGRDAGLYPEISAGQHRFAIRFAEWQGVDQRSRQTQSNVRFKLALC